MDASRYFDAMHNAMSTLHAGAQLLLTVRLQDTCGNDAYLEVKQLPGEQSALVCYSTMGRRCLNFQLFRKGFGYADCSAGVFFSFRSSRFAFHSSYSRLPSSDSKKAAIAG